MIEGHDAPRRADDVTSRTKGATLRRGADIGPANLPRWATALIYLGLAAALLSLYTAGDWRNADVSRYHAYALAFWGGLQHPLLPIEYPPLAILPLSLTLLGPVNWFPDVFAFWMGVVVVAGYLAARRWTSPSQAAALILYGGATGVATLLFRYDLVPALMTAGALWCAQRKSFRAAYASLAIATLLKLFPVVLLPAIVIAQQRAERGRGGNPWWAMTVGVGAFVVIVGLVTVAAAYMDPTGWASALKYEGARPVEVESIPGTLLAAGSLFGAHLNAFESYGSMNIASTWTAGVEVIADVALAAGLLWTYIRQMRGRLTLGQAAMGAVLVMLCTSRVLSAQYFLWLAPLVATTLGFRVGWFFLFLATSVVFPTLWEVGLPASKLVVSYGALFLAGIAIRNALLVFLTVRFFRHPGRDIQQQHLDARWRPGQPHGGRSLRPLTAPPG